MENIVEKLEILIDDILIDENLTKEDIHKSLSMLKTEIEDYNIAQEEKSAPGSGNSAISINWEDLD